MRFAPGAYRVAAVPAVLSVPSLLLSRVVAAVALLASVAVLLFYRDPERSPPAEGVVSPADGTVSVVREEGDRLRVGVFMNVTDVHVNRAPVAGEVRSVEHEPGGNWPAFSKASERNERRRYGIGRRGNDGGEDDAREDVAVVQIAGTLARRTHSYVVTGDDLERGERFGHIAFGSRVDVLLPPAYGRADLLVDERDRVRAGETVIAPAEPDG
jgi:phosphatidylserine decarboxylase